MHERSVLVLGDLMLDVNEHGEVNRVSPEGPVLILANPTRHVVLGGAGNTAANTHSLGWRTILAGVVGADDAAETCRGLCDSAGIAHVFVTSAETPTTVKTRFLARGQQIMRLDRESADVPEACHNALLESVRSAIGNVSAIVISDYEKGVVSPTLAARVIELANRHGIPVVVDTKKRDLTCFRGAAVVTPNHFEATRATGEDDPEMAARAISEMTDGAVAVTLGAQGMLVLENGAVTRIASRVQEVADVTGAGDTVTAAIAVALAEDCTSVLEAATWANEAAAVAVSHTGTYAVPRSAVGR